MAPRIGPGAHSAWKVISSQAPIACSHTDRQGLTKYKGTETEAIPIARQTTILPATSCQYLAPPTAEVTSIIQPMSDPAAVT